MKPRSPSPRNQAVVQARAMCENWEECRDDHFYASECAWALLAAWGAVHRFFAELPAESASVSVLVQRDAATLLAALRQASEPAEWLERSRELDRAWDFAVRQDALRELEMAAVDLFDRLDRHSLALCMARRLDSGNEAADLTRRAEQLAQAEGFFAQHVDAFLPAAPLASAVMAACRPDLEEADPELWRTTRKHRRLEEAWKEAEAIGSPPCLTERDKQVIQAKVALWVAEVAEESQSRRTLTLPFPGRFSERESVTQPMAAGPAAEKHRLLRELASQSPADVPTDGFRRAWAHLLASASQGSDVREVWLRHFLALAEAAEPLDPEWADRLRRAQALEQDRDWERSLRDDGVLRLEPRPFSSLADLAHWLQELVSSPSQGPLS
jgi:hypothetical protein